MARNCSTLFLIVYTSTAIAMGIAVFLFAYFALSRSITAYGNMVSTNCTQTGNILRVSVPSGLVGVPPFSSSSVNYTFDSGMTGSFVCDWNLCDTQQVLRFTYQSSKHYCPVAASMLQPDNQSSHPIYFNAMRDYLIGDILVFVFGATYAAPVSILLPFLYYFEHHT